MFEAQLNELRGLVALNFEGDAIVVRREELPAIIAELQKQLPAVENADGWRDPNPWQPMRRPLDIKVVGKFLEEMGECVEALCGSDILDMEKEVADVLANIDLVVEHFALVIPGNLVLRADLVRALGDCIAATSRCLIQGIEECEPVTKKPNLEWLSESIGGVQALCDDMIAEQSMSRSAIAARIERKKKHLRMWHTQVAA